MAPVDRYSRLRHWLFVYAALGYVGCVSSDYSPVVLGPDGVEQCSKHRIPLEKAAVDAGDLEYPFCPSEKVARLMLRYPNNLVGSEKPIPGRPCRVVKYCKKCEDAINARVR